MTLSLTPTASETTGDLRDAAYPHSGSLSLWRCPNCQCHSYARVSESKPGGGFGFGHLIRCVECKSVFDTRPTALATPTTPHPTEDVAALRDKILAVFGTACQNYDIHIDGSGTVSMTGKCWPLVRSGLDALLHTQLAGADTTAAGELAGYLSRQMEWSRRVFGDRSSAIGLTKHIEKECVEVRANPTDLVEWLDIVILALDGYWRHGGTPEALMPGLLDKQRINFAREWPTNENPDEPNEHARADTTAAPGSDGGDPLRSALEFYADPDTYIAIGFFPDRPCGDFIDDFSDEHDPGYPKPGKRAREALAALARRSTPATGGAARLDRGAVARIGRSVPRNVYWRDVPLFVAASPELAAEIVEALNRGTALALDPQPQDDTERCIACNTALKPGDRVLNDESGGVIHVDCCGPDREGYTINGEPLKDGDPIPEGYPWDPDPQPQAASEEFLARVLAKADWPLATPAERERWADAYWREKLPAAKAVLAAITPAGRGADAGGWRPIAEYPPDSHPRQVWSERSGQHVAFIDVTGQWWPVPAFEPLPRPPTLFRDLYPHPTKLERNCEAADDEGDGE